VGQVGVVGTVVVELAAELEAGPAGGLAEVEVAPAGPGAEPVVKAAPGELGAPEVEAAREEPVRALAAAGGPAAGAYPRTIIRITTTIR